MESDEPGDLWHLPCLEDGSCFVQISTLGGYPGSSTLHQNSPVSVIFLSIYEQTGGIPTSEIEIEASVREKESDRGRYRFGMFKNLEHDCSDYVRSSFVTSNTKLR